MMCVSISFKQDMTYTYSVFSFRKSYQIYRINNSMGQEPCKCVAVVDVPRQMACAP